MATRLAQRMGNPKLRRCAAAALVAWSKNCPQRLTKEQDKLLMDLSEDICWSVRSIANRQREANS